MNSPTPLSSPCRDTDWVVACLCAGWCDTCTAYRAAFEAVAARFPAVRFTWIDIEDDADALGDAALEVENFPTILLMQSGRARFFGTVLPHAATLARTVEAALADDLAGAGLGATADQLAAGVATVLNGR